MALGSPTLYLPPASVPPSSDDASLIHPHLLTFTHSCSEFATRTQGGRLRRCVPDRLVQGERAGKGRGPSAAGGWQESSGMSLGGQSLQPTSARLCQGPHGRQSAGQACGGWAGWCTSCRNFWDNHVLDFGKITEPFKS